MRKHYMKVLILCIAVTAFYFITPAAEAQAINETEEAIKAAEADVQEMSNAGMPVERVNDLLEEAKNLFEAQKALEKSGGEPDYTFVIERTEEISKIKDAAFRARDEIEALKAAIEGLEEMDKRIIKAVFEEAKKDFDAGRFEDAIKKVDEAYGKMVELQAATSRISALLDVWGSTITGFLYRYRVYISVFIVSFLIIAAVVWNRVSVYRIKRKIERINTEKSVLKDMIKKCQQEYFGGKMAESVYYIKIKKYGEMMRELNRQLTVLKASLKKAKAKMAGKTGKLKIR